MKKVLTIAGSDSGGGAGIQADLKTCTVLGVYGSSVITSITAQNTLGVQDAVGLSPELVGKQLDSVLGDIGADAVKTGMLHNPEIIKVIVERLKSYRVPNLVVDPVMVATSGDRLLSPEGEKAVRELLLPLASVITPNQEEASALWGRPIEKPDDVYTAAQALKNMGPEVVIITGVRRGDESVDIGWDGVEFHEVRGALVDTPNKHGTGCTFSSALAAFLARGASSWEAVNLARSFVTAGLCSAYAVGSGSGPLNHVSYFYPGNLQEPAILQARVNAFQNWGKLELGPFPLLNLIIGGPPCQGKDYVELTKRAVQAGVRLIQLREKDAETRELVELAARMLQVCHDNGALLVVNDRVDIAAAVGADGVHVGQSDLSPRAARALMGPGKIVGVSASNLAEAQEAVAVGADYIGLGPVYPTDSKDCEAAPGGLSTVREVAKNIPIPVLAIGGVTPDNTRPILQAGASGVAVISAILGAAEPWLVVEEFMQVFKQSSELKGVN
jgi:hydroxymethylpyrimidine kinase/phosphomethylpyrimidine kinase/thiamine-phosphate diphosphorylase